MTGKADGTIKTLERPDSSRFITADDVLAMARRGERIELSPGVRLTDLAKELATREGLLTPNRQGFFRPFMVAGNWKMNCDLPQTVELVNEIIERQPAPAAARPGFETILCPPFISLAIVARLVDGTGMRTGAQNMSDKTSGAFTGEVSASMVLSCGASFVILGHSERRTLFGETDATVRAKAAAAQAAGLRPIVCVGETLSERENQKTLTVIRRQIREGLKGIKPAGLSIAYEPVWAIGTGKAAKPSEASMVHSFIRDIMVDMFGPPGGTVPILYGGSVNGSNSSEFFAEPEIDGALVGGASLKAAEFSSIVAAGFLARKASATVSN